MHNCSKKHLIFVSVSCMIQFEQIYCFVLFLDHNYFIRFFGGSIFFKPFKGVGHNFLAKLFLSLVSLLPHLSK